MRIPLSKPWIGPEEREAVLRVLDSGVLVQGPEVEALEREWAAACEAEHAVATSSGTTALHVALLAHGVGPGDEVITTPFTFIATTNAILHAGATPVFVDVEEDTFNIDATLIEAAITKRTKAILPVHVFGQPCDEDAIGAIARKHGLVVIEDAAQAMGARFGEKPIGSFHTTCFSLYATKNVMAGGEGGMITTGDPEIARRCRMLRSHGRERKEDPQMLGFNYRMSELHAAITRAQLRTQATATARRSANATLLSAGLGDVVTVPISRHGRTSAWHQYTVRVAETARDHLINRLHDSGCGAATFYRKPAHHHAFVIRGAVCGKLPSCDSLARRVFSIPVHQYLVNAELQEIIATVRRFAPALR